MSSTLTYEPIDKETFLRVTCPVSLLVILSIPIARLEDGIVRTYIQTHRERQSVLFEGLFGLSSIMSHDAACWTYTSKISIKLFFLFFAHLRLTPLS